MSDLITTRITRGVVYNSVSVLSCPRTLQLYHIESLHSPRYLDIPSY